MIPVLFIQFRKIDGIEIQFRQSHGIDGIQFVNLTELEFNSVRLTELKSNSVNLTKLIIIGYCIQTTSGLHIIH